MPLYEFKNTATGELSEISLTLSQYDEFCKNNTHLERYHSGAPSIGDPIRMGLKKPDDAFRDKLKDIKRKHYKSNINTF
ncbi:MAG: hypothetical protein EBU08_07680 [Micrococcales bacterium]|nr:hypothetical protein [Micrococcales bacterium]